MDGDVVACAAARRRVASSKMKRMKQAGCKDQEELDDDNEELFAELGIMRFFFYLFTVSNPRLLFSYFSRRRDRFPSFTFTFR